MDSDEERTSKRQKTSLTQLFNDASPPRESIPNSCSEESSDDEEDLKPLPIMRIGGNGNGVKKMPSFMTDTGSGRPAPAASSAASKPRQPLPKKSPSVQINEGYGGRKEYSVTKDDKEATFYCVQWSAAL
jgi:hypothetical protein